MLFAIKEWQTISQSDTKVILRNAYYDKVASLRNRPIFANIGRYTPLGTPIAAIMNLLNSHSATINIDDSPDANKNKLKKLFLSMN